MDLGRRLTIAAERAPGAAALVDGSRTLTYAELEAAANRLAGTLRAHGVGPGDRVGVHLAKSADAVTALYGVMKAGAAYVPFDAKAPPARLGYIAADCGITTLVSAPALAATWAGLAAEGAPLQAILTPGGEPPDGTAPVGAHVVGAAEVAAAPDAPAAVTVDLDDLAYILYTSGSTGRPKGVMLSHRNATAFVDWGVREIGVTGEDRLSSHAPFHFDLSVFDLYAASTAGACVVLVPAATSVFPPQVARFIREQAITVWYSVPSVLTLLVERGGVTDGDFEQLRTIIFAGEIFPVKLLRRLMARLAHVRFANWYGPTETNVCTAYWVPGPPAEDALDIPIGAPIDGVEGFVVDEAGAALPDGETGELLVRGPTVMRGYWGDAERTDRSLVADPRPGVAPGVAYRTGDLVRLDADGNYRFFGRRDHQIKSRGHRIELGDIEAALLAHADVRECVVVPVPDEHVTNLIRACVAADVDEAELRRHCLAVLPRYMVPDQFEFHDALPRTSTDKLDRQALAPVRADLQEQVP
jgi:amino acid adenylation domain-containing protein